MTADILREARLFLVESLKGQINPETTHAWRKDWRYVVLHTLRVERTILKILTHEQRDIPAVELEQLQLAAVLHDIGKFMDRELHAQAGVEIAREWLREKLLPTDYIDCVVELVTTHSNKTGNEPDFCKAILQDADVLDEIGALSLYMMPNWVDQTSPFYLNLLHDRILEYELPFCESKMQILNTAGAKTILQERKDFLENFAAQMREELSGNPEIEAILKTL